MDRELNERVVPAPRGRGRDTDSVSRSPICITVKDQCKSAAKERGVSFVKRTRLEEECAVRVGELFRGDTVLAPACSASEEPPLHLSSPSMMSKRAKRAAR